MTVLPGPQVSVRNLRASPPTASTSKMTLRCRQRGLAQGRGVRGRRAALGGREYKTRDYTDFGHHERRSLDAAGEMKREFLIATSRTYREQVHLPLCVRLPA